MAIVQTNLSIAQEITNIKAKLESKEQISTKDLFSFLPKDSISPDQDNIVEKSTFNIDYTKGIFTLQTPKPITINAGPAHLTLNSIQGTYSSAGSYIFNFPDGANSPRGSAVFGIKIRLKDIQITPTSVIADFDKDTYVVNYV
jgi:hypothetical protein